MAEQMAADTAARAASRSRSSSGATSTAGRISGAGSVSRSSRCRLTSSRCRRSCGTAGRDLVVETGVARGGSLILSATILQRGRQGPSDRDRHRHPSAQPKADRGPPVELDRIALIEGSSIDRQRRRAGRGSSLPRPRRVMVILDSNHTHEHVLAELELYAPMVSPGQHLVVADTIVEKLPAQAHRPRPWGPATTLPPHSRRGEGCIRSSYPPHASITSCSSPPRPGATCAGWLTRREVSMSTYLLGAKNPEVGRQVAAQCAHDPAFSVGGLLDNNPELWGRVVVGDPSSRRLRRDRPSLEGRSECRLRQPRVRDDRATS